MSHLLVKSEVILARIEVTYGTDPVPVAATHAIRVQNVQFGLEALRMVARNSIRASLGTEQQIYGGSLRAVSFRCEGKGSGAAGTAPEIGPLLRACGLGETIVVSTSVTYAPVSTGHESITLYYFQGGRMRHIIVGARGSVSMVWQAGELKGFEFAFVGKPSGNPTDQTQPVPTYNSTVPIAVRSLDARIGGVAGLIVQNFALGLNNQIETPDNVNDAEGYGNVTIGSRDPMLTIAKHASLVATHAPWADLAAGTVRAFQSGTLGSSPGNRIALTMAQMHYRNIESQESGIFAGEQYVFGCHEAAADSDLSLAFT